MAGDPFDVFVNCAFDHQFKPVFDAIVFAVVRCGFRPRTALETDDGSENRFSKIQQLIEECTYGIHDISRTESDGTPPLPRFNMPLELGVFLGAKRYGGVAQKRKRVLILDVEQYRYQRFMSDVAGQDIHAHSGNPRAAIVEVVNWLRASSEMPNIPGGTRAAEEYTVFRQLLPALLQGAGLDLSDVTFRDYRAIVSRYVEAL
jgi:hypothetical protein